MLRELAVVRAAPVVDVQYAITEAGDHGARGGRASGCPKRFGVMYHFTAARTGGDP